MAATLFTQNIIACIWDFDKTLIPEYMQSPLFRRYRISEPHFWAETNSLIEHYRRRGYTVSPETAYLNHLLTYVKEGLMPGLNNRILREAGAEIRFYPGMPEFLAVCKKFVASRTEHLKHDLQLEHYVVSTGLAEMIRGSAIMDYVEDIWACEFIENALRPGFLDQAELPIEAEAEISQIGTIIDNTTKTRALFEINKGTNKNSVLDVNASIRPEDRRIPFQNMIYIADGPSDIPSFSVIKRGGGKTFAVYNPASKAEFAQNDRLLQAGRIHGYGPACFTAESSTAQWLQLHIQEICDRIVAARESAVAQRVSRPPRHLTAPPSPPPEPRSEQQSFLDEDSAG